MFFVIVSSMSETNGKAKNYSHMFRLSMSVPSQIAVLALYIYLKSSLEYVHQAALSAKV